MKKTNQKVTASNDVNVITPNENQISFQDTSKQDVSTESQDKLEENHFDMLNIWDEYFHEIVKDSSYFQYCKVPNFNFIIGLAIHHFSNVLAKNPKCKFIDIKSLAFDCNDISESKRPLTYYSLSEASSLTSLPIQEIWKGLENGYFIGIQIHGNWFLTDSDIQFINAYAYCSIDVEKYWN